MLQAVTTWSTLVLAAVSSVALIVAGVQINVHRRLSRVNTALRAMAEGQALELTFRYFDHGPDLADCRVNVMSFSEPMSSVSRAK